MRSEALIRAIWTSARRRGLDRETVYDLAERLGGVRSLKALKPADLGRLLDQMNADAGRAPYNPTPPKVWQLWRTLYWLGGIDAGDRPALRAFVRRQTGLDDPQWVQGDVSVRVIEALKAMIDRELPRGTGWSFGGPVALRQARTFYYQCEEAGLVRAPQSPDRFVAWACTRFGWPKPDARTGFKHSWGYPEANAVFSALGPLWRAHKGFSNDGVDHD